MGMITEPMLDALRDEVAGATSEKRFVHTAEVEKMAVRLGELYCPEKIPMLRAAALLHDVTKEYSLERQLSLCAAYGLEVREIDRLAPKTLHARTAAAWIAANRPTFADAELLGCVRWHTTGHSRMTLCEKLIYLADYIDMSRRFPDCVRLRELFFGKDPKQMTAEQRLVHLDDILLVSFDMTLSSLIEEGVPISPDSTDARNELLCAKLLRKG